MAETALFAFVALILVTATSYMIIENMRAKDSSQPDTTPVQSRVHEWLRATDKELSRQNNILLKAQWSYYTNMTDQNADRMDEAEGVFSEYEESVLKDMKKLPLSTYDNNTQRLLRKYLDTDASSDPKVSNRLGDINANISDIYQNAEVCYEEDDECLNQDDMEDIMVSSDDPDELVGVWEDWRHVTGGKIRKLYEQKVKLDNQGARENGYQDTGDYMRKSYENPNITNIADALMDDLMPFYRQLFVYVRRKLHKEYGADVGIESDGPIPAHLLGDMRAEEWVGLHERGIVKPYPHVDTIDVTDEMLRQNYTVERMFHMAEDFFVSIGLNEMTREFWERSMFEEPADRKVNCHPEAWNFHDGTDFRIKMCTEVSHYNLYMVHHEMGHIQHDMSVRDLPLEYQNSANPGFHEAIGDVIALSVNTVTHLKKVGLLNVSHLTETQRRKQDINFLMQNALSTIAFMPYSYIVDKWRWGVYDGTINNTEYNRKWWHLRLKYQGLVPPVMRSERDLDPAAKYHVANDVEFFSYFVSNVLQFQLYEAMCRGVYEGPLHQCDFYQSKTAGRKLINMMAMGSSKPWPDALEVATGTREMSVEPMLAYFKPLHDWLINENANEKLDWLRANETVESVIDKWFNQ